MIRTENILSLTDRRPVLHLLKFLIKAPASPESDSENDHIFLTSEAGGTIAVDGQIMPKLLRAGYILPEAGKVKISASGRQLLQALKNTDVPEQPLHNIEQRPASEDTQPQLVMVNSAESSLAMLYRINKQTGRRFLTDEEFQAGERLRADFTRGNMLPRITANWEANVAKRFRGERGAAAELSDHALDCRDRVEKALKAVGPELSGVLLDICCFLKGLELVERERSWPARSAKMLLKAALSILHRHYTGGRKPDKDSAPNRLYWGAPDYRPPL
ncbi:DUF6456 domain-containing protein [Pseudochrobactrum sp. sp1633]|uniref:DUF6456 domain-containing protein n=1 Tax=Pseudochrobactrum sp. sp1633 TaxID=3036706 RepID=UPI0025A601E3|nr:DUF6456 domain-containing protein [Pseudochrobactrum sp. sp1633]MDM8345191.1 DUF6456 domain-containing protein [Pseudochrobactrum sp. sp1633]HWD12958.1 DUF6456 domain-containing protein [Pseudochrobactrum sp.]